MTENYFGLTDTGKVRDNNEDAFIAETSADGKYIIACAIDGVGGYAGGEVAAAIAKETIQECFKKPTGDLIALLKNCLIQTNEKIIAEKQQVKDHANMACVLTLGVVDIANNQLHYAHVGDTRLYLFRDNSLVKITNDQSFVGFLEDSGRLTEEGAMRHPKRNEIYKALGFGGKIASEDDYIEIGQSPFLPGDIILFCSDGLSDMINRLEISNILKKIDSLEDKCRQLIAAANNNGGLDNITAVLVQNNKNPVSYDATKPTAPAQKKNSDPQQPAADAAVADTIIEKSPRQNPSPPAPNKRGNGAVWVLSILCLALLGSSIYFYLQGNKQQSTVLTPAVVSAPKASKNAQEIKLQDTINKAKGNLLVITDSLFKSPIVLTQPIRIDRDTLFLKVKGKVVIVSDSLNKGNAFTLTAKNKMVFLDGLTFQNFDAALEVSNYALQLKDVVFDNCHYGVRLNQAFAAKKYVSGSLGAAVFKIDSVPAISKK